jgi:hypothetical protein
MAVPTNLVHYQASSRQHGYNNPYYNDNAYDYAGNGPGFHRLFSSQLTMAKTIYANPPIIVKLFLHNHEGKPSHCFNRPCSVGLSRLKPGPLLALSSWKTMTRTRGLRASGSHPSGCLPAGFAFDIPGPLQ